MIDWRFLAGLSAVLALVAWLGRDLVDSLPGGPTGLLAGLAFSLVSLAAGYHWVRWSAGRGDRHFMTALLGGFLARIVGLLAFAVALAFATSVNLAVALLTVVAAHLVLGMGEIVYLNRTSALG